MRVRSVSPRWPRCALIAGLLVPLSVSCIEAQPLQQSPNEITTREAPAAFKSRVNLVTVPVVVRDSKLRIVENLDKEDFQLFDGGKPQIVSRFTVEKAGFNEPSPPAHNAAAVSGALAATGAPPVVTSPAMPQR